MRERREYLFTSQNPSFERIVSNVVHDRIATLVNAITSFVQITDSLAQTQATP